MQGDPFLAGCDNCTLVGLSPDIVLVVLLGLALVFVFLFADWAHDQNKPGKR